ncbi:MAG: TrmB family transcriptional regulator [Ignavibacteria bacterium]|nr:TrmB family transcriptional regulator [Ignavibacteria bacterium]
MSEIIQQLKKLGFTEYESKVFVAVLKGNLMSASEIADAAGIRRTEVYAFLKSFVEKGYCNEIETNSVMKYEMIDPDIIMDKLERKIIKTRQEEIDNLKSTFKTLKPLYKTLESEKSKIVNIELIRGYNQHRVSKFMELFKQAKHELLFMIKLELQVSEELDETAKEFFARGGVIKSIYETDSEFKVKKGETWSTGTMEDLIKVTSAYESYGEQVKLSKVRVPNMTIFDRETVFMNINDKTIPKHNEADIIVKNKDYALNMVQVFESYWNTSLTIKDFKKEISKKPSKNK